MTTLGKRSKPSSLYCSAAMKIVCVYGSVFTSRTRRRGIEVLVWDGTGSKNVGFSDERTQVRGQEPRYLVIAGEGSVTSAGQVGETLIRIPTAVEDGVFRGWRREKEKDRVAEELIFI